MIGKSGGRSWNPGSFVFDFAEPTRPTLRPEQHCRTAPHPTLWRAASICRVVGSALRIKVCRQPQSHAHRPESTYAKFTGLAGCSKASRLGGYCLARRLEALAQTNLERFLERQGTPLQYMYRTPNGHGHGINNAYPPLIRPQTTDTLWRGPVSGTSHRVDCI